MFRNPINKNPHRHRGKKTQQEQDVSSALYFPVFCKCYGNRQESERSRNLRMKTTINICVSAGGCSGIQVEFSSISFYFRSYGDLSDVEMDRVCEFLHNRVQNQERTQLYQLTASFKAFKRYADTVKLAIYPPVECMKTLERFIFQIKLFSFLVCIFLCVHVCMTLCPVLQCCISPCVILRRRFG